MSLKLLTELDMAEQRRRFPNAPDTLIIKTKYSDSDSNSLTKSVKKFLQLNGWHCERVNNMGVKRGNTWTKGTGTDGTADLHSIMPTKYGIGMAIMWEIKAGKDFQRPDQKDYQKLVEDAKGRYYIVKNFDMFYKQYLVLVKEFS